jgi:hypothetical protein
MRSKNDHEPWGRSRLDEDEIGLTTTHVQGECPNAKNEYKESKESKDSSESQTSELSQSDRRERGITMTTEFEWDERKRSPVPRGEKP